MNRIFFHDPILRNDGLKRDQIVKAVVENPVPEQSRGGVREA